MNQMYDIEVITNSGEQGIRSYIMIPVTSLRSRTAALKFQKMLLDLKISSTIQAESDKDKSDHYAMSLELLEMQTEAYRELLTTILIGDWANIEFDLIDENIVSSILTDFFSLLNQKKTD